MNKKSYLMPFEEVVKMLIGKGLGGNIPDLMRLRSMPEARCEDYFSSPGYQECQERYHQTWWEIICDQEFESKLPSSPFQCLYLADSLKDAIRLRPRGKIRFWSCSTKDMNTYLDQMEDWSDDQDIFEENTPKDQYA